MFKKIKRAISNYREQVALEQVLHEALIDDGFLDRATTAEQNTRLDKIPFSMMTLRELFRIPR